MKLKEKTIAILKTIGISILTFITAFLFGKLFASAEDRQNAQKDKIKDEIDTIKDGLDKANEHVNEQTNIITEIKDNINQHESDKSEVVDSSIKQRVDEAKKAGFTKQ
jgi:wobble nucleotide-excising tRNase